MSSNELDYIEYRVILNSYYNISSSCTSNEDLIPMMKSLNYLINKERFDVISDVLDNLDLSKCNTLFMVALIRVTSEFKGEFEEEYGKCLTSIKSLIGGVNKSLDKVLEELP